ncbi:transcription factor IIA, alpha/beta subunit [Abortiporus biennis]|nr:transcription factor IIA, alpha/beta subunit [Abortiporus biennis]
MSNKIVPAVYRAVIDDVIAAIKSEFDEYGVGEEVLADLQHKWETKVIQSHVAEFEPPPQAAPPPQQHPAYPPHPMHAMHNAHYPQPHNPYAPPPPPAHQIPQPPGPHIKAEPVDSRYMLNQPPYALPTLPGPQLGRPPTALTYPPITGGARPPSAGPAPPAPVARAAAPPAQASQPPANRIPQVDGPSSSSSGSASPPPAQSYAPRALHPSLPQPTVAAAQVEDDEEAINSDLDDSDSDNERDGEAGGAADSDIVFCTYDKVARVKNKWKCILKDGMIHVNGKDYLFAKCTG